MDGAQNPRLVWGWRDLESHPVPAPAMGRNLPLLHLSPKLHNGQILRVLLSSSQWESQRKKGLKEWLVQQAVQSSSKELLLLPIPARNEKNRVFPSLTLLPRSASDGESLLTHSGPGRAPLKRKLLQHSLPASKIIAALRGGSVTTWEGIQQHLMAAAAVDLSCKTI